MLSRLKNTEGNAAVEFGLVLPLLLVILLGIIDWGHVHFTRMTMTNAAREGARVGVTLNAETAESEAETAARNYLISSGIPGDSFDVEATLDTGDGTVSVRVYTEDFNPLIGFVPTPSELHARAIMRWELASL